jgi:hypothetical protein
VIHCNKTETVHKPVLYRVAEITRENQAFKTLANDQLDAQILIHLLQSSICTCFEQYLVILRRSYCINTASDIVTVSKVTVRCTPVHRTVTY